MIRNPSENSEVLPVNTDALLGHMDTKPRRSGGARITWTDGCGALCDVTKDDLAHTF